MEECLLCFHDLYQGVFLTEYFTYDDLICGRCRRNMIPLGKWRLIHGVKVFVLYEYNDFMESLLFQFKEGRDIALASLFFHRWNKTINDKFKDYCMVFMPSASQKIKERGFIPLACMLDKISLKKIDLFEKTVNYKQSHMSYEQRKGIHKVMKRIKGSTINEKKLLLVDDVITSGETLKRAYDLVKDKSEEVCALILCDNHRDVDNCD